jgi:dihydrolipoamide dehydrogenase
MASQYDLIVVGSGPGGYVAAIRASQLGMKVGVVEKAELGGICLNWGCIPTKALLKSAQVFEYISHAQDYGINVKESSVDFDGMVKRSRDIAGGMSKGIQFLFKKNKIDHISGHGTLKKGKKVEVKAEDGKITTYEAKSIILATGGRARELPTMPIDNKKIIGYRKAMVMEKQPKKLIIVGSGAIGVEFAYFYNSIGTEVTIVEFMDRIVPVEDQEISKALERNFKKNGIKIMTNSEVTKVDTAGEGCKVSVKTKKGEEILESDIVLSAVGLSTNLENMGLEEAGVKTERGKVLVDDFYKTNVDGVYAIGDIVHGPALAHVASAEGIICVEK